MKEFYTTPVLGAVLPSREDLMLIEYLILFPPNIESKIEDRVNAKSGLANSPKIL